MLKKLLLGAALTGALTSAALAMDDAERARQMELYNAQTNGGAAVTTTTTAPTAMPAPFTPHALPAGAPAITASKTDVSRSMPVPENVTTQTTVTTTAATSAPTPVAKTQQMSPLNDDGTPMAVVPKAETLGDVSADAAAQSSGMSGHDREMKAWQEWQAQNAQTPAAPATTVTTTTTAVAPAMPVTTQENTTTTNYTVTTRKVGMVGSRPYPVSTSQMPGGVTKQVTVNGVAEAPQVIVPDNVAPMKDQQPSGDYYASPRGAAVYKGTVGSVRVHQTGTFN
jgi:hypothetical protein